MAIILNEKQSLFTLQTKNSMYQMKADEYGALLHTYYGKKTENIDYSYLISMQDNGFSGNPYGNAHDRAYSFDTLPQEYPVYGGGDFRRSALMVRYGAGHCALELHYDSYRIIKGKYSIPGLPAVYAEERNQVDTLIVTLKDDQEDIFVHLYYGVMEDLDMITRTVRVENRGKDKVVLERVMSMCLDQQYGDYDFLTFYGKHAMERELSRMPVHHGVQSAGSVRGASSHQYNPFVILADHKAEETKGDCYGVSFLYSGDFLAETEYDQINQTRLVMGIHPDNFRFILEPGEEFWAPEAAMVYSDKGFENMSHIYHKAFRNNLCRGKYKNARRPVLLNNWEGTYFDFNGEKLVQMAEEAAEMGVELFVLDDGWFGKRDSDNSGLGDWTVNEKKLGCTLKELSDRIHELGLTFGIWFEPECVSEDSDLYREHPEWALKAPGKKPMLSRSQLVLDFSRAEVREHIFAQMCSVLDSARIEYVKWDFNRSISDIYSAGLSAERQGEVAHRYVLGLYDILERITQRYPDLLIEGCSGGGGRFDAGMLYYTPQIWCSDDTDAIERLKIQYGTSFAYPVSTVGAHVSASPNHQTGRKTPISTRAAAAMAGTFGYELDPGKLNARDKEEIHDQIEVFKKYYDLIQQGDYYRLTNPYGEKAYHAWEFAAPDGREALVSVVAVKVYANPAPVIIKLRGLREDKYYRLNGKSYLGGALMYAGLPLPQPKEEYESWNFHLVMEK
ncbi:MAG: alpha-galactosidase [Eubacteriales bacterium]|nr:alpha-galactosidase [Eubacteriales bacterium]